MKGYKAFGKGMICRGKQYAENTVFEEEEAKVCECGMHFCKDPLAVLDYYPLVDTDGNMSAFAEVEALDKPLTDDKQKYCSRKLRIGAKIDFARLVQASVEFDFSKKTPDTEEKTTSERFAKIGSSGDYAKIGSSGDYAQIGSSGDYAQIGSSGDGAKIGSSGDDSVICCAGSGSMVKAKKGSWITLSEWKPDNEKGRWVPVCVKTERVDGVRIKEDTFYKLVNGEFVEQEDA